MEPNDRLHKIRDFANLLQQKFHSAKKPGMDIVINETMIHSAVDLAFASTSRGKQTSME